MKDFLKKEWGYILVLIGSLILLMRYLAEGRIYMIILELIVCLFLLSLIWKRYKNTYKN